MSWLLLVLTSASAFVGALLGALATIGATRQRERASRREEWWRRFEYASELALDDESEARREAGFLLLDALAQSELAGTDELAQLRVFTEEQFSGVPLDVDGGWDRVEVVGRDEPHPEGKGPDAEHVARDPRTGRSRTPTGDDRS